MDEIYDDYSSSSDSIVMAVLRSAMDRAHEKVQCKDGPIGFLHERSKFYEVAAILVEAGLSIVQEETDVLETGFEKIRLDLMEIEQWLQGRIKQMKLLIIEKDKELKERTENEVKLRQAYELQEKELVYWRDKKKLERSRSESFQDEGREGDIRELKYSVDQQVLGIKQKLEDERNSLASDIDTNESSNKVNFHSVGFREDDLQGNVQFSGIDSMRPENIVIQQMCSDIDILKGTLDLAFGRMQKAEVLPLKKQWRCTIEKDVISILIKGFVGDIHRSVKAEILNRETHIPAGFLEENWTELMSALTNLRDQLQAFNCQTEREMEMNKQKLFYSPPVRPSSIEPLPEIPHQLPDEDSKTNGSHHVVKMIMNHGSIIRKHEEWKSLTRDVVQGKGPSSHNSERNPCGLERSLREAISRLNNLIRRNNHSNGPLISYGDKYNPKETTMEFDGISSIDCASGLKEEIRNLKEERDYQDMQFSIMEEIYLLVFNGLIEDRDPELCNSAIDYSARTDTTRHSPRYVSYRKGSTTIDSQQEKVERETKYVTSIIDSQRDKAEKETECITSSEVLQHYFESLLREDVYVVWFKEMVIEWNQRIKHLADECRIKEEKFNSIFDETDKDPERTSGLKLSQLITENKVHAPSPDDFSGNAMSPKTIKSILEEDVYMVFFRALVESWNTSMLARDTEILFREDIYQFVILQAIKDAPIRLPESEAPSRTSTIRSDVLIEKLDSLLRFYEVEEDTKEGMKTKGHGPNDSVEPMLTDYESSYNSVNKKLEWALDQLHSSRALLTDLAYNLGTSAADLQDDNLHIQTYASSEAECGKPNTCCQLQNKQAGESHPPDAVAVFSALIELQRVVSDFEQMAQGKLERNCLRVEELKRKAATLVSPITSIREEKLLYKKAFVTRCHNLQLAEDEVDLLANQVDRLLQLLEKIYIVMNRNSNVLSRYFGVSDVLELIKTELTNGVANTIHV